MRGFAQEKVNCEAIFVHFYRLARGSTVALGLELQNFNQFHGLNMENDLRRAQGTMTEAAFDRAAARFKRMKGQNLALARAYLLPPGQLQVDIASTNKISRQLVHKQCKKIYDAHCRIVKATLAGGD